MQNVTILRRGSMGTSGNTILYLFPRWSPQHQRPTEHPQAPVWRQDLRIAESGGSFTSLSHTSLYFFLILVSYIRRFCILVLFYWYLPQTSSKRLWTCIIVALIKLKVSSFCFPNKATPLEIVHSPAAPGFGEVLWQLSRRTFVPTVYQSCLSIHRQAVSCKFGLVFILFCSLITKLKQPTVEHQKRKGIHPLTCTLYYLLPLLS